MDAGTVEYSSSCHRLAVVARGFGEKLPQEFGFEDV